METYSKINTIYKRAMDKPRHPLIEGDYSEPEFEYLSGNQWIGTEKIDGTNTRVILHLVPGEHSSVALSYHGKTDDAQFFPGMREKLEVLFPLSKMTEYFKVKEGEEELIVTLYGETYGPGINKGGNYGKEVEFILFDVKIGTWWLRRDAVEQVAADLNIKVVPVVFRGTLMEAVEIIKKGYNSTITDKAFKAEGMVLFPATQLFNRKGERIITKLKQKDFAI